MAVSTIADRLAAVRAAIAAACARANRPVDSVTLIAVSKTHPPDMLLEAIACGQAHFGENRIEEAAGKIAAVQAQTNVPLTWHMIGHVQSRKARDVVAAFDVIHSLDSLKLAERYARFVDELKRPPVSVLLEVNVSGEDSKSGFDGSRWQTDQSQRESLWSDIRRIIELPGLRVWGLMTMAPIVDDPEQARPVFTALRALRDALAQDFPQADWSTLSMGMTDDYPVAIEEGATMVRIGRAIFGERASLPGDV
ncbi:MAG: YggS family pyridoxal phosphate-dependent enzyme [Anaerolineae bacterium]|nr:YggS family pyridoxal phosphate-dependent enzyme [Anaerolineae bacterium]